MPGVLKGSDLCVGLVYLGCLEEYRVIALGIEWRIEIDQINRLVRNVIAKDIEVIAEEEFVHNRAFS
jgi:hypothetical protein